MDIGFSKTDAGRVVAGFVSEDNDCTVRAWSTFFGVPYDRAHDILKKAGRRPNKGMSTVNLKYVLHEHGAVCQLGNHYPNIRNASITLNQLVKNYPKGKLYCLKRGHAFTVIDGVVHDLSKIGKKTRVFAFFTPPGTEYVDFRAEKRAKQRERQRKPSSQLIRRTVAKIVNENPGFSDYRVAKIVSAELSITIGSANYHVTKYSKCQLTKN